MCFLGRLQGARMLTSELWRRSDERSFQIAARVAEQRDVKGNSEPRGTPD